MVQQLTSFTTQILQDWVHKTSQIDKETSLIEKLLQNQVQTVTSEYLNKF